MVGEERSPGPMLTQEEDVEIHALRKQGRSISAIARHRCRDRKTERAYLAGDRVPGVRTPGNLDPLDRTEPYVRQRLLDERRVWATTLFDEVTALGYGGSYLNPPSSNKPPANTTSHPKFLPGHGRNPRTPGPTALPGRSIDE